MTKGEGSAQAALALLNQAPLPTGVPETQRIFDTDIPPSTALAIRMLSYREPVDFVHGGKIAALRHKILRIQCWAKASGTTPLDTLVDPLVEHVLTRLEGQKPGGSHKAEDAELRWEYATRDAAWVKVEIFLPIQYHSSVGDPTQ